jgi:hypothetical protein
MARRRRWSVARASVELEQRSQPESTLTLRSSLWVQREVELQEVLERPGVFMTDAPRLAVSELTTGGGRDVYLNEADLLGSSMAPRLTLTCAFLRLPVLSPLRKGSL